MRAFASPAKAQLGKRPNARALFSQRAADDACIRNTKKGSGRGRSRSNEFRRSRVIADYCSLRGREQALAPEPEALDSPGAELLREAVPFVLPPVLQGHWTRSGSVRA